MGEQLSYAWAFALNGLTQCGVDTKNLLKKLNIDTETIKKKAGPLPTNQWCEILDEAVRQTGSPDLGLEANLKADFADYGPIGFAALNSSNLGEALNIMSLYLKLSQSGIEASYYIVKKKCILKFEITDWRSKNHRTNIDWLASFGIALIRKWCGQDWSPKEIHFMYEKPKSTAQHKDLISCPVYFSSKSNYMVFPEKHLLSTNPNADPRLFRVLHNDLNRLLDLPPHQSGGKYDIAIEAQKIIAQEFDNGTPCIDLVAEKMNMSTRSLQRHLSNNGCSFRNLVRVTRRHMAINYLKSNLYSISDITYFLGYTEVGVFTRAFFDWTGKTPTQYRKQENEA